MKVKVLAVEADKQRLQLGMKASYFEHDEGAQEPAESAEGPDLDAQLLQQMQSRSQPDGSVAPDSLAGGQ